MVAIYLYIYRCTHCHIHKSYIMEDECYTLLREIKCKNKVFCKACSQIILLNHKIESSKARYDRAKQVCCLSFRYTNRLKLTALREWEIWHMNSICLLHMWGDWSSPSRTVWSHWWSRWLCHTRRWKLNVLFSEPTAIWFLSEPPFLPREIYESIYNIHHPSIIPYHT